MSCTRRGFTLGLCGAAALAAGCGSSQPFVAPNGNQLTLSFSQFPQLSSPGGSLVVMVQDRFPLVVVRTSDTAATALSATCTHAGCIIDYQGSANVLHCPCHDADFDLTGAVLRGPTIIPLPVYGATVVVDGIVVDLS